MPFSIDRVVPWGRRQPHVAPVPQRLKRAAPAVAALPAAP